MSEVIPERDSQVVVRKINQEATDLSSYGPIVEEVKRLLRSFKDFGVLWVQPSANKVAHELAREGCNNKLCKTWLHAPPQKFIGARTWQALPDSSITSRFVK